MFAFVHFARSVWYIDMQKAYLLELCISVRKAEYIWFIGGVMEDKAIKLLYINSSLHALICINQAPAGETGVYAVTQPIAANATFSITMLPLENCKGFVCLPYTRRVSIASKGTVFDNDGLIELCMWPENIVELTLKPLTVYKNDDMELRPAVLAPFEFYISGERHTAFVYNEASSSFVVEHAASNRLKFVAPLGFGVKNVHIEFCNFGEFPLLCASGKTFEGKPFLYTAHLLPEMDTDICTECCAHTIEKDGIYIIDEGLFWQKKTRWEKRNYRLQPVGCELGWFTHAAVAASEPAKICTALLEAIGTGAKNEAMNCLTPSLAEDLSFSDLKEFFGDFCAVAQILSPACGQAGIALKYPAGRNLFAAREFCVETKRADGVLLIDNIREP